MHVISSCEGMAAKLHSLVTLALYGLIGEPTIPSLCVWGRSPQFPFHRRLDRPRIRTGLLDERNVYTPALNRKRFIDYPTRTLVSVPITVLGLSNYNRSWSGVYK